MQPKSPLFLSMALLLTGCSQASSPDTTTTTAEHVAMTASTTPAPMAMLSSAKIASTTGTVESVDAAAGKITLAHDPVDALGWPAMTMGFKATSEQIASVHPGQSVRFEFTAEGMNATITHIALAE